MTNFSFLQSKPEYALFASACIEAETIYASAPAMCAVGCRKALELAVKWVYSADNTMQMPYKDNLQSLIHEPSFRFAVDYNTWGKSRLSSNLETLQYIPNAACRSVMRWYRCAVCSNLSSGLTIAMGKIMLNALLMKR